MKTLKRKVARCKGYNATKKIVSEFSGRTFSDPIPIESIDWIMKKLIIALAERDESWKRVVGELTGALDCSLTPCSPWCSDNNHP